MSLQASGLRMARVRQLNGSVNCKVHYWLSIKGAGQTINSVRTRWLYCVECPRYSTRRI